MFEPLPERASDLHGGASEANPPRCPYCEYIVAGLPQPRCPECGAAFTWDEARRSGTSPPAIAFERARGARKLPAFLVTWLTVMFAPWVFARQAAGRIDGRHALAFGGACFAFTWLAMIDALVGSGGADLSFMIAWGTAALAQILAQTLVLYAIDVPHHRPARASLGFWLAIGGYTSAVMTTEIFHGPPPLEWDMLLKPPLSPAAGRMLSPAFELVAHGVPMLLWLAGLACVVFTRIRRAWGAHLAGGMALLAVALVYVLSIAVVQWVGWPIGAWLD